MKYLLIADIPAPWREKVYEFVYKKLGDEFHVVYCSHNEKRRQWVFPLGKHPKTYLKKITVNFKNRGERFINPGIITFLLRKRPKNVICFGIYPTAFIAYFVLKLLKCRIGVLADTWLGRERYISWDQKLGRKLIYKYFGDAYIGASKKTLEMFKTYNNKIDNKSLFLSHLCADNQHFMNNTLCANSEKKYDLIFSGRLVETKKPIFFAEVASRIRVRRGSCNVLIIGDGDQKIKNNMFHKLADSGVDYYYAGFIPHENLPEYYLQAKILLLPTLGDCWGVVINEAFASGLPVITTKWTAAANELVIDGRNGYILPIDAELWAEKINELLNNNNLLKEFSKNSKNDIQRFTFENAAQGLIDAFYFLDGSQNQP